MGVVIAMSKKGWRYFGSRLVYFSKRLLQYSPLRARRDLEPVCQSGASLVFDLVGSYCHLSFHYWLCKRYHSTADQTNDTATGKHTRVIISDDEQQECVSAGGRGGQRE